MLTVGVPGELMAALEVELLGLLAQSVRVGAPLAPIRNRRCSFYLLGAVIEGRAGLGPGAGAAQFTISCAWSLKVA